MPVAFGFVRPLARLGKESGVFDDWSERATDDHLHGAGGDELVADDVGDHGQGDVPVDAEGVVVDLQSRREEELLEARVHGIRCRTRVGGLIGEDDLADRADLDFSELDARVVESGGGIHEDAWTVSSLDRHRGVQLSAQEPVPVVVTKDVSVVVEPSEDIEASCAELHVAADARLLPVAGGNLEAEVDAGRHVRREACVVGVHAHIAEPPPAEDLALGFGHRVAHRAVAHGAMIHVAVLVDVDAVTKGECRGQAPLVVEEVLEAWDDPVRLVEFVVVVAHRGRAGAAPVLALGNEAVFGPDQPTGAVGSISGSPDVEAAVE